MCQRLLQLRCYHSAGVLSQKGTWTWFLQTMTLSSISAKQTSPSIVLATLPPSSCSPKLNESRLCNMILSSSSTLARSGRPGHVHPSTPIHQHRAVAFTFRHFRCDRSSSLNHKPREYCRNLAQASEAASFWARNLRILGSVLCTSQQWLVRSTQCRKNRPASLMNYGRTQ